MNTPSTEVEVRALQPGSFVRRMIVDEHDVFHGEESDFRNDRFVEDRS